MIKVTVILKNFTDLFYTGRPSIDDDDTGIKGFNNRTDADKFAWCAKSAKLPEYSDNVSIRIGTGQFRDAVELNSMLKRDYSMEYKLENRRGYKLATFLFKA